MSDKPKKKITWKQWQRRTMLIILAVVAVFVALYFAVYRQPQPLMEMDCVMNHEGEIIELQGTGEGRAFTIAEQRQLVDLCAKGIREIQAIQKAVLEGGDA